MRFRIVILGLLCLLGLRASGPVVLAQGWVAARVSAPSLGAQSYLNPGSFSTSVGYRWQHSDRHFVGDVEQTQRAEEGSQVINDIHSFDLSFGYQITKRVGVSLSIPFQLADRSQVVRSNDTARTILQRFSTQGDGLGDIRLLGTTWLLDPDTSKKRNVSLGLGLKFPTGEKDATGTFKVFNAKTKRIEDQLRTVDQSIQPGDGGWGLILDLMAFMEVLPRTTLFAAGTYIITPEERSGVPTFRNNPFEAEMSISDQYLGRVGVGYALTADKSLSVTLAGRIEGVPVHDAIGGSEGFRRPGFGLSIEPGLVYSRNRWVVSASAPVALYRNRERSVPDLESSTPTNQAHGDAAFADYILLFSVGRTF